MVRNESRFTSWRTRRGLPAEETGFCGRAFVQPRSTRKTDISGGQNIWARGIHFSLDYQPPFFQMFGVLAFGPEMNVYPVLPMNPGVASSIYSTWAYGGSVRYQARFFREQLLVPVVGYDYEHLMYHLNTLGKWIVDDVWRIYGVYILMNSSSRPQPTTFTTTPESSAPIRQSSWY